MSCSVSNFASFTQRPTRPVSYLLAVHAQWWTLQHTLSSCPQNIPPLSDAVRRAPLPGNINTIRWWVLNPDSDCLPHLLSTSFSTENPHLALPLPRTDTGIRIIHFFLTESRSRSSARMDGSIGHPPPTIHAEKRGPQHIYCYVRDAASGSDRKCYVILISYSLCC